MSRLRVPHLIRDAHQRREEQDARLREAVRRAHLADRTPQTWDPFAGDGRPS